MIGTKKAVKAIRLTQTLVRITVVLLIIGVVSFIGLHVFINLAGKNLLARKLEKVFKHKVTIGSVSTSLPSRIKVTNIEVKDLCIVEEVVADGGLIDVFSSDFKLSTLKIKKPVISLQKDLFFPEEKTVSSLKAATTTETKEQSKDPAQTKTGSSSFNALSLLGRNLFISRLKIRSFSVYEGSCSYIDKLRDNKSILIKAEHINVKAENLNYGFKGRPVVSTFELTGSIPWQEGSDVGKINIQGWIDPRKKDMQAKVKIEDIDGIYLYPYYSMWVNLENTRIEKAKLDFSSNISGLNNELTAACHLELKDIVFTPRPAEEVAKKGEKIANVVLDIFKTMDQGKVVLDFTIRTKMDQPQFGMDDIRYAVQDKLIEGTRGRGKIVEEVVLFPARLVEGILKGAADISKATIDGLFGIGNELKKGVEGSLKEEPKS